MAFQRNIEQIKINANAIKKALKEKGVSYPERLAVYEHSYGAFMVANLLSHTNIFKTEIARQKIRELCANINPNAT